MRGCRECGNTLYLPIAHSERELAIVLQEFTSDPDGTHDLVVTRPWLSGCHQTISEIRQSTVVAGYQVPGYGTVGEMYIQAQLCNYVDRESY